MILLVQLKKLVCVFGTDAKNTYMLQLRVQTQLCVTTQHKLAWIPGNRSGQRVTQSRCIPSRQTKNTNITSTSLKNTITTYTTSCNIQQIFGGKNATNEIFLVHWGRICFSPRHGGVCHSFCSQTEQYTLLSLHLLRNVPFTLPRSVIVKDSFSGMYEILQCCLLVWISWSLIVLGPKASLPKDKKRKRSRNTSSFSLTHRPISTPSCAVITMTVPTSRTELSFTTTLKHGGQLPSGGGASGISRIEREIDISPSSIESTMKRVRM